MKDRYFCLVDNPILNVNLNLGLLYEIDVANKRLVELPQNFYKRQNLNDSHGWASFSDIIAEYNGRYFTIYNTDMSYNGEISEFNFNNNQFERAMEIHYDYRDESIALDRDRLSMSAIKN